ncbi:MAG TPA: MFS transporter [Thermomicrobiales bacterium]
MLRVTPPTLTETPANRVPITGLLAANIVSLIGSMLTLIALPWFVLQTTGSAAKTGLTGFFVALPFLITGIFGGTVVDRLGYKRSSVIADIVSGIGIALVPLLYYTVGLAFWQLLALVFLGNLLAVPGLTARRALLPELATAAGWRLERVNAAFEGAQYIALLLGPPVAGLLIALFGASRVLWLDAASFFISAIVVALVIPHGITGARRAATGSYREELVAGLRFLRNDRVLLALAINVALATLISSPYLGVVLPVFTKRTYDSATALGIIVAAMGGGSVIGAVIYGAVGHRLSRRLLWIGGYIVNALPLAMIILTHSLPLIVVALGLGGMASGPLNPLLVTIRHERIPVAMRGRVFSTFSAIASGAQPLGLLVGGNLLERIGLGPTVFAITVGELVVGIGLLFVPALRELDAPAHAHAEPAAVAG